MVRGPSVEFSRVARAPLGSALLLEWLISILCWWRISLYCDVQVAMRSTIYKFSACVFRSSRAYYSVYLLDVEFAQNVMRVWMRLMLNHFGDSFCALKTRKEPLWRFWWTTPRWVTTVFERPHSNVIRCSVLYWGDWNLQTWTTMRTRSENFVKSSLRFLATWLRATGFLRKTLLSNQTHLYSTWLLQVARWMMIKDPVMSWCSILYGSKSWDLKEKSFIARGLVCSIFFQSVSIQGVSLFLASCSHNFGTSMFVYLNSAKFPSKQGQNPCRCTSFPRRRCL